MIYYFAYGSNISSQQMNNRCPNAVFVGTAKLNNQKFIINSRGVATIVPEQSIEVHGAVWNLSKPDEQALDDCEGVKKGIYIRDFRKVQMTNGETIRALVYVASDNRPGSPRENYLENIVACAKQLDFSNRYITELETWATK